MYLHCLVYISFQARRTDIPIIECLTCGACVQMNEMRTHQTLHDDSPPCDNTRSEANTTKVCNQSQ